MRTHCRRASGRPRGPARMGRWGREGRDSGRATSSARRPSPAPTRMVTAGSRRPRPPRPHASSSGPPMSTRRARWMPRRWAGPSTGGSARPPGSVPMAPRTVLPMVRPADRPMGHQVVPVALPTDSAPARSWLLRSSSWPTRTRTADCRRRRRPGSPRDSSARRTGRRKARSTRIPWPRPSTAAWARPRLRPRRPDGARTASWSRSSTRTATAGLNAEERRAARDSLKAEREKGGRGRPGFGPPGRLPRPPGFGGEEEPVKPGPPRHSRRRRRRSRASRSTTRTSCARSS